jgi:hypothetical protein
MSVASVIIILSKGKLMTPNAIIFYNGFNLLLDIVLIIVVARVAYRIGFNTGYHENEPPF